MPYSTLYTLAVARPNGWGDTLRPLRLHANGADVTGEAGEVIPPGPDLALMVVGTRPNGDLIVHGLPGDAIPKVATVYYDGSAPWTWNQLADDFPSVSHWVTPHEYFGEPSARNLVRGKFSRLAVIVADEP